MAKAKGTVLKFQVSDGTTLQDLTSYIDSIGAFNKQADQEETTPFGATDATFEHTGLKRIASFQIAGYYDDDDPGPVTVLDARGETREVEVTWMSGQVETVDCLIQNFQPTPTRGMHTRYTCTLQPTGALT